MNSCVLMKQESVPGREQAWGAQRGDPDDPGRVVGPMLWCM